MGQHSTLDGEMCCVVEAAQLVYRINSSSSYSLDQDAITNIPIAWKPKLQRIVMFPELFLSCCLKQYEKVEPKRMLIAPIINAAYLKREC